MTNSSTDNSASALPNETKPSGGSVSNYQVAPNLPKYLKIPKLGTNARVKPLGITSNGALQTPNNIYDTGWYDASARPGDPGSVGAILIDGHVRGPTLSGVFNEIKQLRPGDTMQIVRGDNQVFNYKVVKVQNYDASSIDMGELLASVQPGEPGLNLITCGGSFNRSSWEYTQRTVVFAVQL
jgi:sortase (surface protein transpeptidase)